LGLHGLSDEEQKQFVTDRYLFSTLGKYVPRKKHDDEIENKYNFYKIAKDYFGREVCEVRSESDYPEFERMVLKVNEVMLKPNSSALGHGIQAVTIASPEHAKEVFSNLIGKGTWIVEERIRQDAAMAVWNESSVNTVRYMSFLNNNGFFSITPFLRTGRKGSVVDNAGSGGVFANINVKTGVVCTDGVDEHGNRYAEHPDSKVVFNGWKIPKYEELVATVREMHETLMPSHPYIGWDMALTDKGWIVIECNWGQFVNQIADHIGRKEEFLKYINGR